MNKKEQELLMEKAVFIIPLLNKKEKNSYLKNVKYVKMY